VKKHGFQQGSERKGKSPYQRWRNSYLDLGLLEDLPKRSVVEQMNAAVGEPFDKLNQGQLSATQLPGLIQEKHSQSLIQVEGKIPS
jgi:hypothetical protein